MNKRSKKSLYIIAGAFIVFGFLEGAIFMTDKHKSLTYQIWKYIQFQPVLDEARKFYGTYEQELELDELLLVRSTWPKHTYFQEKTVDENNPFKRLLDYDEGIDDLEITRQINSLEDLRVLIQEKGTVLNNHFYSVQELYSVYIVDPVDDVILKSLYCDKDGYDEFDYAILEMTKDDEGGYLDTHYLLNLLLLEKNNCYHVDKIQEDKEKVIQNILGAQKKDLHFSDLYAERIVFLYWAGEGDQVQEDWIQKIKVSSMPDHGWSDLGQRTSNPHTTGLAALAVKYFLEGDGSEFFLEE